MQINKLVKLGIIITIATITLATTVAMANAAYQIPTEYMPNNMPFNLGFDQGEGGSTGLITIIQIIAGSLLYIAAPLAVIAIAMAAWNMVQNSGNAEKAGESKKQLQWAVLGLVTIIFSYALVKFLISFIPDVFDQTASPTPTPASETTEVITLLS